MVSAIPRRDRRVVRFILFFDVDMRSDLPTCAPRNSLSNPLRSAAPQ